VLLIQEHPSRIDLDEPLESDSAKHWHASPQAKFERLLRETGVPIGLLFNRSQFRLVYAPRGETSGYATFNVDEMAQVAGRPMFAALHMLLNVERLFSLADKQRLPYILENSRKYQNTVSTALAEQVTSALFELLRGFQAANDQRGGELLRHVLANNPQHVYHGLLTVLMRLVFVLYAEDRGLVSSDPTYTNHYSVSGLFERLRSEAGRFPDTMDQRFGAWAQLLTLFRLVYEGGQHAELKIPARKGYLFDPTRYPFLEGRDDQPQRHRDTEITTDSSSVPPSLRGSIPHIADGPDQPQSHRDTEKTADSSSVPPCLRGSIPHTSDGQDQPQSHRDTEKSADSSSVPPCLRGSIPHISDGVVYRVLEGLLILDGERLSYRTLDVEQIGSVYEAIMGFELQVSAGKSIAIRPVKSHGAPATINLEALLAAKPADRAKLLNEWTDQKLGASDAAAIKDATSIDELVAALDKKIAKHVTPGIVPADSMVFQPSDERRRSGSHYTPRSLTQPIVKTTLEPILKQLITHPEELNPRDTQAPSSDVGSSSLGLGATVVQPRPLAKELQKRLTKGEIAERERAEERRAAHHTAAIEKGVPHPSQILDLKVCDPAMGSGAFLVEACRQLGDELIKAWYAHDMIPADIPPDEDEVLYARRTVAQRCLYGVDKNIMAVDLAKLSLWLVTLAKDHPFTFLDHSLRHGDSLVGLTREQIIGFHWEPKKQMKFGEDLIQKRLDRATEARAKILSAREDVAYRDQEQRMAVADEALNLIRLVGDACVSCFFAADKTKARERDLERVFGLASSYFSSLSPNNQSQTTTVDFDSRAALQKAADRLKAGPHPVPCFHWEIEFPEVFARENGGFDALVGNPPFLGGTKISTANGEVYSDWIVNLYEGSSGNADLVAHFFRRTFKITRMRGSLGLIATNTVGQGETRAAGLKHIVLSDGTIYAAKRRMKWPGQAAVIVSVVHLIRQRPFAWRYQLDGKLVERITSFLFTEGGDNEPAPLAENQNLTFKGSEVYGMGFTFDKNSSNPLVSSLEMMKELIERNAKNKECIFPYIGGEEVNDTPNHTWDRYVIGFGERTLEQAEQWPDLMEVVRARVKPQRDALPDNSSARGRKQRWWQWSRPTTDLYDAIKPLRQVLVCSRVQPNWSICFMPRDVAFSDSLVVFAIDNEPRFCVLQSRVHESWARFFASSMKDDMRYTSTTCFETFPFPATEKLQDLENNAHDYPEFRQELMTARGEGLTQTYNRFHSPDERDEGILELRRLHNLMDVAVLQAYGWDDLADQASQPDFCQFLLDYEDDEDDSASDSGSTRQKKKPWRYRWPDDFRDEVLARLLELNEQRHKEELLAGAKSISEESIVAKKTKKKPEAVTKHVHDPDQPSQKELF
jgi:hypothetical protein